MFVYLVVVLFFIVTLIVMYFTFIRIYYTDAALNQFREVRHASIIYLSNNVKMLPNDELLEHQDFLTKINAVIEHFDKIKVNLIRFKSVKSIFHKIIFSSAKLELLKQDKSEKVIEFKHEMASAIMTSFRAIPFLRIRILFEIYRIITSILVAMGFLRAKRFLFKLNQLSDIERNISNNGGCLS